MLSNTTMGVPSILLFSFVFSIYNYLTVLVKISTEMENPAQTLL